MPTKRDAAHFGSKEYIEDSFRAMAVIPDEVGAYSEGCVEEVVGYEVSWVGSKQAARREWVERFYGEYFGNEASMAMFYTAAAFAAVIPPAGERATINRTNRAKQLTAQQLSADRYLFCSLFFALMLSDDADDLSDSGDQNDSGSEDDQGDYKPPASKKGNLGNKTQKIHVTGGQGGRAGNGSCTVTLPPGAGLKELKAALRKKFGKVSHSKMGSLMLVDENGHATNSAANATDLVDGARVQCTYTYAEGNVHNLMGGCMGFRRRGFGGFGGFWL
eukprot:gene6068-6306_t